MTLAVFPAEEGALPLLLSMEEAVFSEPWSESTLAAHLHGAYCQSYLLTLDGQTVGYLLSGGVPPESELYRIAVLPSARQRGGARLLLTRYLADRQAAGDTDFFLEVRRHNPAARALYESVGYTLVGERKNYYVKEAEDACIYSLRVSIDHADSGI